MRDGEDGGCEGGEEGEREEMEPHRGGGDEGVIADWWCGFYMAGVL